jgi:hypothetical protein
MNWPLIICDLIVFLPITIVRSIIIYICGSKYNIKNMRFLDVIMHANDICFNQQHQITNDDLLSIDTLKDDVTDAIKIDTNINSDIYITKKSKMNNQTNILKNATVANTICKSLNTDNDTHESIYDIARCDNINDNSDCRDGGDDSDDSIALLDDDSVDLLDDDVLDNVLSDGDTMQEINNIQLQNNILKMFGNDASIDLFNMPNMPNMLEETIKLNKSEIDDQNEATETTGNIDGIFEKLFSRSMGENSQSFFVEDTTGVVNNLAMDLINQFGGPMPNNRLFDALNNANFEKNISKVEELSDSNESDDSTESVDSYGSVDSDDSVDSNELNELKIDELCDIDKLQKLFSSNNLNELDELDSICKSENDKDIDDIAKTLEAIVNENLLSISSDSPNCINDDSKPLDIEPLDIEPLDIEPLDSKPLDNNLNEDDEYTYSSTTEECDALISKSVFLPAKKAGTIANIKHKL